MFRSRTRRPALDRRGASLMVVLAMLTLFAIAGLAFAMYAGSAASSSRIAREAENKTTDLPDAADAASQAVRHIIFPVDDTDLNSLMSAFRGHSLTETAYGYNRAGSNDRAYDGVGPFQQSLRIPGLGGAGTIPRSQVINFTLWQGPAGNVIVDAEYVIAPSATSDVRTGADATNAAAITTTAAGNSVYVGKNTNYTYPDRNNTLIGMVNPVTGEVVVPSGHRHTLFNASLAASRMGLARPEVNSLPDTSDDWLTPEGRFRILRPRPVDHLMPGETLHTQSQFPYPPPNPDGTYTGDVQNQRYTDGRQRNDSVWMMGTPNVITWRGKQIMALYAPLITPLDGRINVNVAGNIDTTSAHKSNQGWGPWEINLNSILPTNGATLINNRHGGAVPSPRGTTITNRYFHADPLSAAFQLQPYDRSRVDWDGRGTVGQMALPNTTTTRFSSDPVWPNATGVPPGPFDNSSATEAANHPSMFNPYQRNPFTVASVLGTTPGTFPPSDIKQFARYSGRTGLYSGSVLGRNYPSELTENGTPSPGNAANQLRSLITPISNSRKVHNLAPNFLNDLALPASHRLRYSATAGVPFLGASTGGSSLPTLNVTPGAAAAAMTTDGNANTVRNLRSVMPSVNLNRPLRDYRVSRASPLQDMNVDGTTNADGTITATNTIHRAWTDRVVLARDIFQRLAIVTGAQVKFTNGTMYLPQTSGVATPPYRINDGINPPIDVSQEEYDALRWLAQLAANIVDYIDADDICTPFPWNALDQTDPLNITPYAATKDNFASQTIIDQRVVFGTEKPRLVLNEIYADIANLQTEVAGGVPVTNNQVRFFIELLAPGNNETVPVGTANPIPTNAPLRYPGGGTPYSVYQIEVHNNGVTVRDALTGAASAPNVTGTVTGPTLTATISPTVASPAGAAIASADAVEPNNGNYRADVTTSRHGFAVIGPTLTNPADPNDPSFIPDVTNAASVHRVMMQKPNDSATDALQYTQPTVPEGTFEGGAAMAGSLANLNANGHGVLLRRLANPYLPPNTTTNPYITVDYVSKVHVNDAVRVFNNAVGVGATRANVPMPVNQRATGRVGPYTGNEGDPAVNSLVAPVATYNTSLTVPQQDSDAAGTPVPGAKQHSLFRHNGTTDGGTNPAPTAPGDATLRVPFGWLTHLDRRLVNQIEMMHVSPYAPHHLTQYFGAPQATAEPVLNVQEFYRLVLTATRVPWYRVLETLSVSPWTYGVPDGVRVPGKVNVNMIWDQRVLQAIIDARPLATGGPNYTLDTDVTNIWTSMTTATATARTPNFPNVGVTRDEDPTLTAGVGDWPIRGLGQALFNTDVPTAALPQGSGRPDTILDRGFTIGQTNPYLALEPLRKAYNNLTTTSDTFELKMTVGWFEVRNPGPHNVTNKPILGKEVFDKVPGDMRVQFGGVIDRTNLAIDLDATGADLVVGTQRFQPPANKMWSTELVMPQNVTTTPTPTTIPNEYYVQFYGTGGGASTAQIYYDGQPIDLTVGTYIRLGTGSNAQTFQITGLGHPTATPTPVLPFDSTTGLVTVRFTSLTTPTSRAAGDLVTGNMRFGSAGPQPSFDVRLPAARSVVPFWTQIPP